MMKKLSIGLVAVAALAATLSMGKVKAAPAFSFETIAQSETETPGPDGFFGLGAQVTQSTIGVTDGSFSMKYLAGADGFVGSRTLVNIPTTMNNPPGVQAIIFDMTIESLDPDLTFADIGVTTIGHDLDNASFGNFNQFADTVSILGLGIGQHLNLRIDLDNSLHPPVGASFNEIYGDDPTDLDVVSGFQFYISKNVAQPVTVYIDNVRTLVPEPATGLLLGACAVAGAFVRRR